MGQKDPRIDAYSRGMRKIRGAAVLAALWLPGAVWAHSPASCDQAKRLNHWCEAGNVGYIASVPIRSHFLFEVLDAHGHRIVKEKVTCGTCRKALATDGYCPAHKMGFVRGEAYMSSLTYHLARARRIDVSSISCPVCRRNTQGIGWCDKDQVGIAGLFAVDDRREFAELETAYALLLAANDMATRCETCAGAMIADGYCAIHRVKFEAGKAISGTPP